MLNKRGIVTAFIIVGILIVGLTIGIYYTKDYILRSEWQRLREQPVPEQARDVKDFVDSCVKEVGGEAIRLVGMQAGYVEVPGDPIELSRINIFSNGLVVGGSLKVPYWLYEQANKITKEQMPSKDKIEKEISNYINNNLKNCLGDFENFRNYNIKDNVIKTETDIQDDRVLFTVNYPLHIELKDFYFDFKGFYEKVDVPLGELYNVAKNIYYKEKNEYFLEEQTIDWMGQYEEIPLSGTSTDCIAPFWFKERVIYDLKKILFNNVQFLKVRGSDYVLADESHERFVINTGGKKGIDSNFMFSERWPFFIEIEPDENGLLKAQSITDALGRFRGLVEGFYCMSTWHFVYNVKYPVLITLSKDDYTFQFALQVIIDRNEPRKSSVVTESIGEFDKRFCNNKRNILDVYTIDETGNSLEDVSIKYKCINHICDIGVTELDAYGDASLKERFPMCVNGAILASKEGYHTAKEIFDSTEPGAVTLKLEKYRTLDVDVMVSRAGSGEVENDEIVYIDMREDEKGYGAFVVYPDQKEIKLIPGNYFVRINILTSYPQGITFPKRKIRHCIKVPKKDITGVFGGMEEKCFETEIPAIELNQIISGVSEFEMSISESDLKNNKIKFYVPYHKPTSLAEYANVLTPKTEEVIKPKFENVY